jgi:magnesium transporter
MIQYLKCDNGFKETEQYDFSCWINVVNPTKDDINELVSHFNTPDYFYEDISDIDERPRFDRDDGWILTIIRVPNRVRTEDNQDPIYTTIPLGMMLKDNILVTVYYGQNNVISNFINWSNQKKINRAGYDLYISIFLESNFWYLKYLKQIHLQMKKAESSLSDKMNKSELMHIMNIEKFLVYFTASLKDNESVLTRAKRFIPTKSYDEDLMDDVEVELSQALHTSQIYSDILEREQSSYSSIINNSLNQTMKKMTIITICLMVAALVPGFYGMNLTNGMEDWIYGFPFALCLTGVCAGIAYYLCKLFK